ncbi:unnamed protein product [Bemisia tabaci]|uniref:ENTH domain-containing protein n=1 Tax=Bemisia tabaci TaxID=7038 RepID=A0A9P0ANQ8_BEMTA|nr:unnamed protein product [Bemisia tabaci]
MFTMWKVREIADKVTNVVMNYTEVEAKVREATNDDAWGPTGALMQEIAQATFTFEHFPEVMTMLWKRMLQDNKKNWRRTYKSLLLLNYLVRNGSERVVTSSREHIFDLRSLENYTFIDEFGKDQGVNIRHKVRDLIEFIQDDEKLREERKKAKKNKDKYVGMSSDGMGGMRGGWEEPNQWRDAREDTNEWSQDRVSNDSENGSDDNEKFDSDGDVPTVKEDTFKVKAEANETISKPSAEYSDKKKQGISIGIPSPAKSTTTRNIKKIDLGAAANYGKTNTVTSPSSTLPEPASSDLLGDFSPVKTETKTSSNDFGDFAAFSDSSAADASSLFGAVPTASGGNTGGDLDEFADFNSAFSNNSSVIAAPTPAPIPSFPVSTNTSTNNQSNADLLLGLSVMPNVQSQPSNSFTSLPNFANAAPLQPVSLTSNPSNNQSSTSTNSSLLVGKTWKGLGDLNIDLDNLSLSNAKQNSKASNSPSMNQLANSSPVKSPVGGMSNSSPFQNQQNMFFSPF